MNNFNDNMEDVLNTPMAADNDAGANTIRQYLMTLLSTLWIEEEGFSGKRPFGNSGWKNEVYGALVKANLVKGKLDEEGYLESVDEASADQMIAKAIAHVFLGN